MKTNHDYLLQQVDEKGMQMLREVANRLVLDDGKRDANNAERGFQ